MIRSIGPFAGFGPLLAKELTEIRRTWRWLVLPGLFLFFAVTGPVFARLTPQLLRSVVGAQAVMPEPTYVDSWAQWTKNLTQLGAFVLLGTLGSLVSGEIRQGTALLVLTKPVSRTAFLVAKVVANTVLVVVSAVVGVLVTWGLTVALFTPVQAAPLIRATAAWLVFAGMVIGLMAALSARFSTLSAVGLGFGVLIVLSLLGVWGPATRWTPAGLPGAVVRLGAGEPAGVLWPAVTTGVLMVGFLLLGIWALARREL